MNQTVQDPEVVWARSRIRSRVRRTATTLHVLCDFHRVYRNEHYAGHFLSYLSSGDTRILRNDNRHQSRVGRTVLALQNRYCYASAPTGPTNEMLVESSRKPEAQKSNRFGFPLGQK